MNAVTTGEPKPQLSEADLRMQTQRAMQHRKVPFERNGGMPFRLWGQRIGAKTAEPEPSKLTPEQIRMKESRKRRAQAKRGKRNSVRTAGEQLQTH